MRSLLALPLLCLSLAGCLAGCAGTTPGSPTITALASPAGQLFCAIDKNGGSQIVVGLIDAEATANAGALAPVAILATNAAAATVQADCDAAAAATGASAGVPVSPPQTPVANVAIVPASS